MPAPCPEPLAAGDTTATVEPWVVAPDTELTEPADTTGSPWLTIRSKVDSHARALAKAVSWRVVGSLDTFVWGLVVTRRAEAAGAIASLEVFTKIGLFYLHERAWRLLKRSPNSRVRSLAKSVSWRFVGGLDTFLLSLIVTGNAKYAVSIASIEALTKIGLYFLHERAWRRVSWGRLDAPLPT
jgi:uncharacterized membrane protein